MKKLISIAAMLACTVSMNATLSWADATETDADVTNVQDTRIKIIPYEETDVYTLTTKPGYQTNVVFGRGEEIQTISVGDRSFWQIIPAANRLFIRPMNEDVTTNMTVLTNRHSYQFDLKSISADAKGGNIYVAQFAYPDTRKVPPPAPLPPAASQPFRPPVADGPPVDTTPRNMTAEPAAPSSMGYLVAPGSVKPPYTPPPCVPPECVPPGAKNFEPKNEAPAYASNDSGPGISHPVGPNFNYSYSGPDDLSPLQVYDDGKSTYISYRQSSEPLPNIYLVDSSGAERPTTYYIKGNAMVIDNVAPQMALKSSSGTVYIYNELLSPSH